MYIWYRMAGEDHNPKVTQATELATGVDTELVKKVWNCAVQAIVQEITSEELRTVRLPHIGKFTPNFRYMKHKEIEALIPKPDNGGTKSV